MADNNKVDFYNILERCEDWQVGQTEELRALGVIIQGVHNGGHDNDKTIKAWCKALLEHNELPAFFKAKVYLYLSTCRRPKHAIGDLYAASSWLVQARRQCDVWVPIQEEDKVRREMEEIKRWEDIVEDQKTEVNNEHMSERYGSVVQEPTIADQQEKVKPKQLSEQDSLDSTTKGEGNSSGIVEATPEEKADVAKAQKQPSLAELKADDATETETQACSPKDFEATSHAEEQRSVQEGEDTAGTLRILQHRPKRSATDLAQVFVQGNGEDRGQSTTGAREDGTAEDDDEWVVLSKEATELHASVRDNAVT